MKFKVGQRVKVLEKFRPVLQRYVIGAGDTQRIANLLRDNTLAIIQSQDHDVYGPIYYFEQNNCTAWIKEIALRKLLAKKPVVDDKIQVAEEPKMTEVEWLNRVQANFRQG